MSRREDDVNKKLYQTVLNRLKEQGVDVNFSIIESIVKSKWEFIAYVIRFGQLESYRDKYLGNFGVKKWRPATKEYRFTSVEEKARLDQIPSLEKLTELNEKHNKYRESVKFEQNKLYFPVIMTDKKGKETEFLTLKDCSEFSKIDPIHIYLAAVKGTYTKKGLKFRFKTSLKEIADNGYKNKKGNS